MSKQSVAKERQGYITKPMQCSTCANFRKDVNIIKYEWGSQYDHMETKNKRCSIGGFAVQSTASCSEYAKVQT